MLKKLKSGTWYPFYNSFYEHVPLDSNMIFFGTRGGKALEGNIFALCRELEKDKYNKFKRILVVNKTSKKTIIQKLKNYDLHVNKIVETGSLQYYFYCRRRNIWLTIQVFREGLLKKRSRFISMSGMEPL